MTARYATLPSPWGAIVQVDRPQPSQYVIRQAAHTLNHGMPALRRGGPALRLVGRHGVPVALGASMIRRARRRAAPDLDRLRHQVEDAWDALSASSPRLPTRLPQLSLLATERRIGRFVFVFGDDPHPLLLLKPAPAEPGIDPETVALRLLVVTGIAPRPLPSLGGLSVLEGVPGHPLWVVAPGRLGWSATYEGAYDALGGALLRITEATAAPGRVDGLDRDLDAAIAHTDGLTSRLLDAARRDLRAHDVTVLEHQDLSAQNWLVSGGPRGGPSDFSGLIDWEDSRRAGLVGGDALHAAVALLEHGVALRRWSMTHVRREFARAWVEEPVFEAARRWHRACVIAATGDDALAEPLEFAYFAARLGRSVTGVGPQLLDVATVRAMLDTVAGTRRTTS